MPDLPAILGGVPVRSRELPITRATVSADARLHADLAEIVASGSLTNGRHVSAFEREAAAFLGVEHAVATSSCTSGLMLVLRCLGLRGEVVLPSFTFMASAHAVAWNGLAPVFVDIDPDTFTLDPAAVAAAMGERTAAIMAVHTFGAPCDMEALSALASSRGVPLVADAAHGFGGAYPDSTMIGSKGLAEVFSLSPTKLLTAGEGGLVTTDDDELARELRIGREYANPGDYDSRFAGLSARLPEMSAALARHNLPHVPARVIRRRELAERYLKGLAGVGGVGFQRIPGRSRSTYKDFCVTIDEQAFGVDRDGLVKALHSENISTRTYFDPPVHRQRAYRSDAVLPRTDSLASRIVALPLSSHLDDESVDEVCSAIRRVHAHGPAVAALTA
ncbi:DegT/DnrJ/EryC1/StrS aminotransferase [Lentzea guizhouensis]|uniref:DegT/DnrJ/EryC1/StrS aminotransferase n=1 Tax=Lentzea guizhouensis TaxID=1586287 RepID=A0A1B2HRY2_9PSEU|nr:DegT/DnrJ/EryC1/StrS family aminotransferase [Lentzea guizhouensis]ANZ40516.1 DegT/DnrJ/EryC1/StrS aminotransferase [Lentzea guizhouensis]